MSDLDNYVDERKKRDKGFAEGFDEGYEQFKIGEVLRQAREAAGLTQEELAIRVHKKKRPYRGSRITPRILRYQPLNALPRHWANGFRSF
jgi:hypothetical protein